MNRIIAERGCKLFTPGPVNIPERVAHASAVVCYHHRTKEFSDVLRDTLAHLKKLFGTEELVMPVHTTGRGALEGVYTNVFTEADKVLSVANGSFGEMAVKTLERIGVPCVPCFEGWETQVDLQRLEELIVAERPTALTVVHSDTSNGIANPIEAIGGLARKYGLLLVVDVVSALGCMPFEFDGWGVDAAVVASQKGLMSPAGISFVAMSGRARERCEAASPRDYYINFREIRRTLEAKWETPGTTPVSLVLAVNEALNMILEEGVTQVMNRHAALSAGTKSALEALGFPLFPEACEERSDALTVCKVPEGLSPAEIVSTMRSKYHLAIGKGLKQYADSTIRIAHMGYCYVEDMLQCIAALEATLAELGYPPETLGKGLSAFMEAYDRVFEA